MRYSLTVIKTKLLMSNRFLLTSLMLAFSLCGFGLLSATEGTASKPITGRVVETMDAGGYTYLLVDDGTQKSWVACSRTRTKPGDKVRVSGYFPMKGFRSDSLKRTFDTILFASKVQVGEAKASDDIALPKGHPVISASKQAPTKVEKGSIKKVRGGFTVEELLTDTNLPEHKTIKVRGVVVKFSGNILGRNWIHIQDGTGEKGTDDLTVTSKETVKLGESVVITGKIRYKQEFGANYSYPVLIEEASISRE